MKDDVENMKIRTKSLLITFMLLATLLFVTACVDNSTPYDKNDANGYTVSVKFDANGGLFTTNTSVITDSYNISGMNKNVNGNVELGLLAPDNAIRGTGNYFTPAKNGYFLAGWYTERTETGKDADGNPIYSYANKWDFEKGTFEVDPSKTYSASEPVLTLYAAWVPLFQINFYSVSDGELIGKYTYNPTEVNEIKVPQWGEDGAMEMYNFPVKNGYTFEAAYYDKDATKLVEKTVKHNGTVNLATGTAENATMDLYVDLMEGNWFHIYNMDQFLKHAAINGSYVLHTDLDFKCNSENKDERKYWPSALSFGTFVGTIEGNGHTISNVSVEQNNNSKVNWGLFGMLSDSAKIKDVTFDNVTFTIAKGTRTAGTTFGLLAGTISGKATLENIQITNSTILVDEEAYFGTDDYAVGKFCGVGYKSGMDFSGITCQVLGDKGLLTLKESGNEIVLEFKEN